MVLDQGDGERNTRLLQTLEQLLTIEAVSLTPVLTAAAEAVAAVLAADKVDVFLYQPGTHSLEAIGVSDTPMGRRQRALGMDRLQLVNGGLAVEVFATGESIATGQADQAPRDLPGVVDGLGVRSELNVALPIAGQRRGVLQALSGKEAFFVPAEDLPFLEAVAHWIGTLAHRAELVGALEERARAAGHREARDEILTRLTPRQREILRLIEAGLTNAEIGERLVLSPDAVANQVDRMLRQLGLAQRTQLAARIDGERARQLRVDELEPIFLDGSSVNGLDGHSANGLDGHSPPGLDGSSPTGPDD